MTCWERTAATVVECPSRSVTSRGLEEIVAVVQTARSREEAGVDGNDPFSRELRSARDRIAELQRRSRAGTRPGGGLLPEALAELDGAIEELSVTGQELHEQTAELTSTRLALESERERYQALFEFAPVAYLVTDPVARILGQPGGGGAARRRPAVPGRQAAGGLCDQ